LPFKIVRKDATQKFVDWAGGLWFAPSKLKLYAQQSAEKLNGIYMPYWTYDTKTVSDYTGMRGDYYYVPESYTDSDGRTQTIQVQRTRWSPASGTVHNEFDDILIVSSASLPETLANELEPWDLPELVSYNDKYLSGFITESYQVDLRTGFEKAKQRIQPVIRNTVENDIGGDVQQVASIHSDYNDITFKHILLPVWLSSYKYKDKVYRFLINARTGEVQGERPYSAAKIAMLVISILVVIGTIIYFVRKDKG